MNKTIGLALGALLAAAVLTVVLFVRQTERTDREGVANLQGEVKEKWVFKTGGPIDGAPALDSESTLYVGSRDGYLYAIDSSGALKWKFETGPIQSSPTLGPDEAVYVTNTRGKLYAINHTGTKRWETELTGGRINYYASGNAIDSDFVYTFCAVALCSTEVENGSRRWYSDRVATQSGVPVILPSGTIAVLGRTWLKGVGRDGALQWVYPPVAGNADGRRQSPSYAYVQASLAAGPDDVLYAGTATGSLLAVGMGGQLKWEFKASIAMEATPPVIGSDGTIYFATRDGRLYAVDPDGAKKWDVDTGSWMVSSPALAADGTIYVISGYAVVAVSPEGKKEWSAGFDASLGLSPTLAPYGTIYVATASGAIYAFPGTAGGLMASPWPKYQRDLANSGRAPSLRAGLP
ncbi:MAG: PQQ-binding-like beta-propeller repeat protein [Candidatus Acidiferrales bacterium]